MIEAYKPQLTVLWVSELEKKQNKKKPTNFCYLFEMKENNNNFKKLKNMPATLQQCRISLLMLGNTEGWKHWLGMEPLL